MVNTCIFYPNITKLSLRLTSTIAKSNMLGSVIQKGHNETNCYYFSLIMCLLSSVVERWSRIFQMRRTSKVEGEDNQRPRVQSSQGAMTHRVFIILLYCNIFRFISKFSL
jgi:hypothetical protein